MRIPLIDNCLNMWETILSKMEQHPVQMVVSAKKKSKNELTRRNGEEKRNRTKKIEATAHMYTAHTHTSINYRLSVCKLFKVKRKGNF